ncbi:hypothetical protein ACFRKE_29410 [Kitasatospora indigofera]|uniref:hypothetical protein n=1 Tax=Kitasatospora indigofera TaxID=67307 RepID=UPI0036C464D5
MVFDRISFHRPGRKPVQPARPALAAEFSRLEAAVAAEDSAAFEAACRDLQQAIGRAEPVELRSAGPRLAGMLAAVPPWPRAYLAVMTGACVENGADPVACSGPILAGVREALEGALRFAETWERAAGDRELPEPEGDADPDEATELLLGGADPDTPEARDVRRAVTAWWTLHLWEMAAVAVLSHAAVRRAAAAAGTTAGLLALADRYAGAHHELKCLTYAAATLDEEPLLVLDRPSGTGYLMRMSGVVDNFQLHTLLAHVLIGGRHLAGEAPERAAVEVCRAEDLPPERRPHTTGSFNLLAPDGSWIWNEGTPSDIPVVDGVRTLVLDPPPYRRSWPAGRFIPGIPGDLVMVRVLTAGESAAALAKVSPSER